MSRHSNGVDEESLWFAGWSKLGAIYGVVRTDGSVLWSRYEDAIVGSNSFSAQISPTPDKTAYATVRETAGEPPEIVFKTLSDADWKPVTQAERSGLKRVQRLSRGSRASLEGPGWLGA